MTAPTFSLTDGGPIFGLRRALGLLGEQPRPILRMALVIAVTWLPLLILSAITGQLLGAAGSGNFAPDLGAHARLLFAIPLLILAERPVGRMCVKAVEVFALSGALDQSHLAKYDALVQRSAKLRDSTIATIVVVLLLAAHTWVNVARPEMLFREAWTASAGAAGGQSPAGWWYLLVGRPLYFGLQLIWLYRLVVWAYFLHGLAGLKPKLVAAHPDRYGGLGVLERVSGAFAPVVFAISLVVAGTFLTEQRAGLTTPEQLHMPILLFAAGIVILVLAPMLTLTQLLVDLKRNGMARYGAVIARHARFFESKWTEHPEQVSEAILGAPEVSSLCDFGTNWEMVKRIRYVPAGRRSAIPLLLAALLPMLVVLAWQLSIGELIKVLVGAIAL